MQNNYTFPGLKKMSFKDFMDNDNYIKSDTEDITPEPFTTLNSIRTSNALELPSEQKYTLGTKFSPKIDEIPKTIGAEPSEPVLSPTSPEQKETTTAMDAIPEFAKKKIFGLSGDEFVALAGGLAQALAPDTAQGRVGGFLTKFAQPIISARRKAISEAPEQDLAKRLTEAKIANLEKSEDPKTAISWFVKNNPNATPEEVASFKKSLESDQPGSYWRTVSDDGTVTIYKGGTKIHSSKPGIGKTKEKRLYLTEESGYQPTEEAIGKKKPVTEKTATPVNWGTASKSLSARFGKQDATGNFIITKDLQNLHRVAQKKLVELKKAGVDPLEAVNVSEDYARKVEESYWSYIDNAGINHETGKALTTEQRNKNISKTEDAFKKKFGYVPSRRPL